MPFSLVPGLAEFLFENPLMAIKPTTDYWLTLSGQYEFAATYEATTLTDCFELLITVPFGFPKALPNVTELGGRIPRTGGFHVNGNDRTLCLGSPLRLLLKLQKQPDLVGFVHECLVPYLYAISKKLKNGGDLVFSELAHGDPGMLHDYKEILKLESDVQVIETLRALTLKKRRANKRPCPCRCGKRLGRCRFNWKVQEFRALASRSWYKTQHSTILKMFTSDASSSARPDTSSASPIEITRAYEPREHSRLSVRSRRRHRA